MVCIFIATTIIIIVVSIIMIIITINIIIILYYLSDKSLSYNVTILYKQLKFIF